MEISANSTIPTFKLYGEAQDWTRVESFHCEQMGRRRSANNEVTPHRHNTMSQIIYLKQGQVTGTIDGKVHHASGPTIFFIPPPVVHGFSNFADAEGLILTIRESAYAEILTIAPTLVSELQLPIVLIADRLEASSDILQAYFNQLIDEYNSDRSGRLQALVSLFSLILLSIVRLDTLSSDRVKYSVHNDAKELARRFRQLLTDDLTMGITVAQAAQKLSVTEARLTKTVKRELSCTPQEYIHRQVMQEAQRQLVYTTLPSTSISNNLGFKDPAYFSRFFKRHANLTPKQFRIAHE